MREGAVKSCPYSIAKNSRKVKLFGYCWRINNLNSLDCHVERLRFPRNDGGRVRRRGVQGGRGGIRDRQFGEGFARS